MLSNLEQVPMVIALMYSALSLGSFEMSRGKQMAPDLEPKVSTATRGHRSRNLQVALANHLAQRDKVVESRAHTDQHVTQALEYFER